MSRQRLPPLQVGAARAEDDAGATRLTSLSASLLEDLKRFEPVSHDGDGLEALEVLAAAVRHGRALLLHLQHQYRVIPLTVFPAENSLHCTLPLQQLLGMELSDVLVLHVEPAWMRPPGQRRAGRVGEARHYAPARPAAVGVGVARRARVAAARDRRPRGLPRATGIDAYNA